MEYVRAAFETHCVIELITFTAGSGKSVLASHVVDEHTAALRDNEAIAYFYCSSTDATRHDLTSVLCSLVRQLSVSRDGQSLHHAVLEIFERDKGSGNARTGLSYKVAENLLGVLTESYSCVTLIVDGLDECNETNRSDLIRYFDQLLHRSTSTQLKIFVTSRFAGDMRYLLKRYPNIGIEDVQIEDDIRHFVNQRILDHDHRIHPLSVSLRDQIADRVVEQSHGMYVELSKDFDLIRCLIWLV